MEEMKMMENPEPLEQDIPEATKVPCAAHWRPEGFSSRVRMALALVLSVATVFCKLSSPQQAGRLQKWIVGDGSERVQQAFFRMEEALGEGESVTDAWTVFCQELTDETA